MITYIHHSKLEPHPDNPRQDLGDLTELAASIKKSGLLQNLTVVRSPADPDKYRIIIGHRRFAASELAGLEELPCAIEEMSAAEQVATMLAENMQRNELTISDQVYGVQTMMNLGEDIKAISDKTGLSRSTVRRRVKLGELDSKKLAEAEKRGASLLDLLEAAKIENRELREAVLKAAGTASFANDLAAAKHKEKTARAFERARPQLESWAQLMTQSQWCADKRPFKHERTIDLGSKSADLTRPADAPEDAIFICLYARGSMSATIFRITGEAVEDEDAARRAEESKRRAACRAACDAVRDRMFVLREYFMKNGFRGGADQEGNALRFCKDVILQASYNSMNEEKRRAYADMLDGKTLPNPALEAATAAWCFLERSYGKLDHANYEGRFKKEPKLDLIYGFLLSAGYEMSDEEKLWREGRHPCFFDGEADA